MDQVAQIREKIDLVSLISEYLPLKQLGRNFKRTCPFHNEKSPSFVVSPERQIWHCFGCGKGGDAFTFLMEYENLEFFEALRILAKKAGIELITSQYDAGLSSQKEIIFRINRIAAEFYHFLLTRHNAGKIALQYLLEKRKIKPQVIDTFMLGFSPRSGNVLSNYLLQKKSFTRKDILASGISLERRGEMMDFFLNRLMFPLFDHRENIIGFSGRSLDSSTGIDGPKYVNTRETLVYHKGSTFFGLNITKQEIKKDNKAIIMEGEFDVMSSFQEGIGNVVAVKGTALTDAQVNLISRFATKVCLCFDKDSAGKEAIKRSVPLLEKKGLTVTVIGFKDGKDADEIAHKDPIELKKAVKNDIPVYDYLFFDVLSRFDKKEAIGKKNISEELLPFFAVIDNEIVKEHYLKKLSQELDVSYESILRQVEKISQKSKQSAVQERLIDKKSRLELLEQYLLALVLQSKDPNFLLRKAVKILANFRFKIESFQKLFDHLVDFTSKQNNFDSNQFLRILPKELVNAFDVCFLLPLPKNLTDEKIEEEVEKVARALSSIDIHSRIKELGEQIKDREKNEKLEELEGLQKELSDLVSLLPKSL